MIGAAATSARCSPVGVTLLGDDVAMSSSPFRCLLRAALALLSPQTGRRRDVCRNDHDQARRADRKPKLAVSRTERTVYARLRAAALTLRCCGTANASRRRTRCITPLCHSPVTPYPLEWFRRLNAALATKFGATTVRGTGNLLAYGPGADPPGVRLGVLSDRLSQDLCLEIFVFIGLGASDEHFRKNHGRDLRLARQRRAGRWRCSAGARRRQRACERG